MKPTIVIAALAFAAPSAVHAVALEIPASFLRPAPLTLPAGINPLPIALAALRPTAAASSPIFSAPDIVALPAAAPASIFSAPALAAAPAAALPAAASVPAAAPRDMLRGMAASDGPERGGSGAGAAFDGAGERRPANFDEIPPLDARYASPESRARTVTILGSSKSTEKIQPHIQKAERFAGELVRRGYNVLTGAGNAGIMGAAYKGAAEGAKAPPSEARGENLVIVVRPAWGDENLTEARAIGIADSESERVEKFHKVAESFVIFPGSAATLQEAAALIAKNKYRGKAAPKRVILVGKDFFRGLQEQYQRLYEDGLLGDKPADLFRVVDSVDELLEEFTSRP